MKLNAKLFKEILKKATLNYSYETVQLNFKKNSVKSGMIASTQDSTVIINLPYNNILPEMKDNQDFSFNFNDPNSDLLPLLSLVEDDENAQIEVSGEKIVLISGNQRCNIHFCSPEIVRVFTREQPKDNIIYFYSEQLTDAFMVDYNKIKRIGAKFGKIYVGVRDKMMYMETTNKQNMYSNSLNFDIVRKDMSDFFMFFDYKNIVNAFSVLGDEEYSNFKLSFHYSKEQDLGLMFLGNNENSEKYYIVSKRDL